MRVDAQEESTAAEARGSLTCMAGDVRGELTVVAVGAVLLIMGALATGEMGRALTGGGMVFVVIGLILVAVGLMRGGWGKRSTEDRHTNP